MILIAAGDRKCAFREPRNSDGNPDYPQAVVFLTSLIDVTVGS